MGKIIKKQLEEVIIEKKRFKLGMKGHFVIEFANDNFGPYEYKFEREDCYFSDGLNDRGTKIFPLKNKKFKNTEIFLETNDIVIATGERGSLIGDAQTFVDIINIQTEKKYRIFTSEVNVIYNTADTVIVNCKTERIYKTFILNIDTLEIIETKDEELLAFFKCIYNTDASTWYLLDFSPTNSSESDIEKKYKSGSFSLKKIGAKGRPEKFDREKFVVGTNSGDIDIWENSIK